jgi:hypothetical protein
MSKKSVHLFVFVSAFLALHTRALWAQRVPEARIRPFGWVELFSQWASPQSDSRFSYRYSDAASGTLGVNNLVLGFGSRWRNVYTRLALQIGIQPVIEYGTPSSGDVFPVEAARYIHEAYGGIRFGRREQFSLQAGVMGAPIGPEGRAVHREPLWGRSILFWAYPFYLLAGRASWIPREGDEVAVWLYQGWATVNDVNTTPGVLLYGQRQLSSRVTVGGTLTASNERSMRGGFRSLLDLWVRIEWQRFLVQAEVSGGFDVVPEVASASTRLASIWTAESLLLRWKIHPRFSLATRGDLLYEQASPGQGIFISGAQGGWITSLLAGCRWEPVEGLALYWDVLRWDRVRDAASRTRDDRFTSLVGVTIWFND